MPRPRSAIAAALALLAATLAATAGDLNPPNGPVAESLKDLNEVEPSRPLSQDDVPININARGAYHLTGNLSWPGGAGAVVTISVSDVTLDLRGYTIDGFQEVAPATNCVDVNAAARVTIRNGSLIRSTGTIIAASTTDQVTLADLKLSSNTTSGGGLDVGDAAIIHRVTADNIRGTGITAESGCRLQDCTVNGATNSCFDLQDDCTLDRVHARDALGFAGIDIGSNCVLTACTASNNAADGISAAFNCVISDCAVRQNMGVGILAFAGSVVRGCSVISNNGNGIQVNDGLVAQSVSRLNGGANIQANGATLVVESLN